MKICIEHGFKDLIDGNIQLDSVRIDLSNFEMTSLLLNLEVDLYINCLLSILQLISVVSWPQTNRCEHVNLAITYMVYKLIFCVLDKINVFSHNSEDNYNN